MASAERGWARVESRTRVAVMAAAAVVGAVATGLGGLWGYAALVGWDAAALVFVVWVLAAVVPMSGEATAAHASREDPGAVVSDVIVILAAVASLAAVGFVLVRAAAGSGAARDWLAGFGLLSVALSWLTVHTLFTLRYARLFHAATGDSIDFHQSEPPSYLDFAYLSFTIGMTFQVSDTDIHASTVRHAALRHALLSYLFGAVILAATVNLIAGLGSGGGH